MKIDKLIKILLAILFIICLAEMPYGFYQLVRFIALIGFAGLAYIANERQKNIEAIIYVGLALLFQPIIKIALGREIWNFIDVLVALALLASLFLQSKDRSR